MRSSSPSEEDFFSDTYKNFELGKSSFLKILIFHVFYFWSKNVSSISMLKIEKHFHVASKIIFFCSHYVKGVQKVWAHFSFLNHFINFDAKFSVLIVKEKCWTFCKYKLNGTTLIVPTNNWKIKNLFKKQIQKNKLPEFSIF